MKRFLLFFAASVLGFSSCVDEVKSGAQDLDYSRLYELRAQIEERLENAVVGIEDGMYPESSYADLQVALEELNRGISSHVPVCSSCSSRWTTMRWPPRRPSNCSTTR